jgi:creatinine amidohydrolase
MRIPYEDNTSPDIAQAAAENAIVVLQLGCIEQHGPHLPVGCDYGRPIAAAERAREKHGAKVLVLPTLPFGPAGEHIGFPGTISLSFETWSALVVEILENLLRDGFRRIVVAKGCGGHMGIEGPVYQFYCQHKREMPELDVRVFGEQAWAEIGRLAEEAGIDQPPEVHAGAVETSGMMASKPELVRLDRARKPDTQGKIRDGNWWIMEELSETGVTGDPTQCDAEFGRKLGQRLIELFADFLGEMWQRNE